MMALLMGSCALAEPPVSLPEPSTEGAISLEQAIQARRSVRDYTDEDLEVAEIGQLLWAAQGVSSADGRRTAPSAGALYPLEVYVASDAGVHHYLPDGHRWQLTSAGDPRPALAAAALGQGAVADAPVVLVIAGVVARTAEKYGDRAERYVFMEAGHAGQNVLLQAVALGLGGVPIAAFDAGEVQRLLGLPSDHEPLYLIPVGHPDE